MEISEQELLHGVIWITAQEKTGAFESILIVGLWVDWGFSPHSCYSDQILSLSPSKSSFVSRVCVSGLLCESLQLHTGVCITSPTWIAGPTQLMKFNLEVKILKDFIFPLFLKCLFRPHDFLRKELPFY